MKGPGAAAVKCVVSAISLAAVLWYVGSAGAQPPGGQGGGRGPQPPGQGSGGPGGRGGPGGFGGGPMFGGGFGMGMGSGLTELLRRQDVRKELELLDDQVKQLETLEQKQRDRMREAFSQLRPPAQPGSRDQGRDPGGDQDRGQGAPKPQVDFRQLIEQQNKEVRAELEQILLPHQLKRLEQLSAQLRTQGGGMSLLSGDVARDAGITDDQRNQLRSKVEEIEKAMRNKEAELHRQARDQVLSLLPADQQQKIRDMLGEPFTFEVQMPPQFGPPGSGGTPRGPERKN